MCPRPRNPALARASLGSPSSSLTPSCAHSVEPGRPGTLCTGFCEQPHSASETVPIEPVHGTPRVGASVTEAVGRQYGTAHKPPSAWSQVRNLRGGIASHTDELITMDLRSVTRSTTDERTSCFREGGSSSSCNTMPASRNGTCRGFRSQ